MSKICSKTANDCNVNYLVDIGGGLGHLTRRLAYEYGLNICCLDQQINLTNQAKYE